MKMEETIMAKKVVLAGACRTAIGTMGGGLSTVPAEQLGSIVIKEARYFPQATILNSKTRKIPNFYPIKIHHNYSSSKLNSLIRTI